MRFGKRQILSALFTLAFVGAVVMAALWAESAGDMGKAGGTRTTGDTERGGYRKYRRYCGYTGFFRFHG